MRRRSALYLLVLPCLLLGAPGAASAGAAADAEEAEEAALAEGFEAYLHKDFATTARVLGPHAERGEPHAQYMLGALHARGEGVARDPVRAHAWLSLAAEGGHDAAARLRDELGRGMTPAQLAEAAALASGLVAARPPASP